MVDLGSETLNSLLLHQRTDHYNPSNVVLGEYEAYGNWAKGMYNEGYEIIDQLEGRIRCESEACDCLQGFQIMHSIGGGTGSGLGSLIMSRLREEYSDRTIATFSVIPSSKVSAFPVEPYNAAFTMHHLIKDADMCFTLDNEAIYDHLCDNAREAPVLAAHRKSFEDLNAVINTAVCDATRYLRFPHQLHGDLRKLVVKMAPFPRLHFLTMGSVPIWTSRVTDSSYNSSEQAISPSQKKMDILCTAGSDKGCCLTSTCVFKGQVSNKDGYDLIQSALSTPKRHIFSTATTFNVANHKHQLDTASPDTDTSEVAYIANNIEVREVWKRVYAEFSGLYRRKAFLAWYMGEGMDEMDVVAAQHSLRDLIADYEQRALPSDDGQEVDAAI